MKLAGLQLTLTALISISTHASINCLYTFEIGSGATPPIVNATQLLASPPPGMSQYITGSILNTGGTFGSVVTVIKGSFTINTNFTFDNCNVLLDNSASILILPSGATNPTLTIKYSWLRGCEWTWSMIYIAPACSLKVERSFIEDAEKAVFSDGGGYFDVDGTLFNKNWYGFWVENYTSAQGFQGVIKDSEIRCTQSVTNNTPGNYMLAPHANFKSLCGVYTYHIDNNWTIGNYLTTPSIRFFNLNTGVYSDESQTTVNNVHIDRADYGIWTVTGTGNPTIYRLDAFNNRIENFLVGIHINRATNCNIQYNQISDAPGNSFGVRVSNQPIAGNLNGPVTVLIKNNTLWNISGRSISCSPIAFTSIFDIMDNTINAGFASGQTNEGGTGIWVTNNSNILTEHLRIKRNTINNVRTGIFIGALNKLVPYRNSPVIINDNVITYDISAYPQNISRYGFNVQISDGIIILNNAVSRNTASSQIDQPFLFGFNIDFSEGCQVGGNVITNMATGVRARNNNTDTRFRCNQFNNCFDGFRMGILNGTVNATISNQGNVNTAWSNEWDVNSTQRLTGIANPFAWFYNGTNIFNNTYYPHLFLASGAIIQGGITGSYPCPIIAPAPLDRDEQFLLIVNGEVLYDDYVDENTYYANHLVYRVLAGDPELLNLGNENDAIFQEFFNFHSNGNIGKFTEVGRLVSEGLISEAIALNSSITPKNLMEQNQKTVNEIFMGTILYGHELNPDQIAVLEGIACQEAITGGSAVYEAREMLGQSPDMEASCGSPRIAAANYGTSNNPFVAYPNPASHEVIFNFNTSFGENARVKLTDVNGRLVEEKKYEGQSVRIPVTALKPGIYSYSIITDAMIYSGRLSVVK